MLRTKRLDYVWWNPEQRSVGLGAYTAREDGVILDNAGTEVKVYADGTVRLKTDEGVWLRIPAHRLIAVAFVPNPNGWNTVKFFDGDKMNRAASNLYWASMPNNTASQQPYGNKKDTVIRLFYEGLTPKQIAVAAECSKMYVYKVLKREGLHAD